MKNIPTVAVIILVIVVGGAAFFGGIKFAESKRSNRASQLTDHGGQGQFQGRFGGSGGRPVNGEIINADDKSITVKLSDGSSKIVLVSDSTSVNKATQGERSDLKTGERVFVVGQENSDGSVTAQNIQLNPAFRDESSHPQQQ